MSTVLDALNKLQAKQFDALTKSADRLVTAADKVSVVKQTVQAKTPELPASVAGPLAKLTAPVTKVVGTRAEFAEYRARSIREWVAMQQRFTAVLLRTRSQPNQD